MLRQYSVLLSALLLSACDAATDHDEHEHTEQAALAACSTDGGTHNCPTVTGAVPAGSVGSGSLLVRSTTEQPSASDIGAFRVVCDYSHMNNDDPILYPNQPGAAHHHTYFGNKGANASSTYQSLRNSGNSTCRGGIGNRSAYWIPSLLRNGVPVKPVSAVFYYKAGYSIPNVSSRVQTIPAGLRIIAGSAGTTRLQELPGPSWGCENNYVGHHPQIVDCPVGDNLQLSIEFPQCWNGRDLDSADHKSHMAYPVNGNCPSTHPVVLPEITFNIRWARTADLNINELRLSSDCIASLPGGYSAHGDWFEAWDPAIRDAFVRNCINPTRDCHAHLLGDGREIYGP